MTQTRPRVHPRALVDEALSSLAERPGRSILTAIGTVVGTATLVSVLGLAATISVQVSSRFDATAATEVRITDARLTPEEDPDGPFPVDADARLERVNGVISAGVSWMPIRAQQPIRVRPEQADIGVRLPVIASSAGYLRAAGAHVEEGVLFSYNHDYDADMVAVVGSAVAAQLGISHVEDQPAIFIGGVPFTVVGVIDNSTRAPELLLSITVPRGAAEKLWGVATPEEAACALVTTAPGAAVQVASELQLAVRPDRPELLSVTPPPDPRLLREAVDTDMTALFAVLGGICVFIGAAGIGGATLIAVIERIPEIGLRRAIGARRWHIMFQVMAESAILALIGGLVGTSLGVIVVVSAALFRGWSPVVEPTTMLVGPVLGLVSGLLAGAYPAYRAGSIEPVEALRG